ncbi:MAG: gliding motility-associated C-terminal domain-containing protein, partial [Phycisphaerae bacterium]
RLYIYNRWGTMVFQTSDPDQAWTGNLFDGESYSQTESFVWRIELERLSDGLYEVFEGTVTLIR